MKTSITVSRLVKPGDDERRLGITVSSDAALVDTRNSPHVIRSNFTDYLSTDFGYNLDWEHPVTHIVYSASTIKACLLYYRYISPTNYKVFNALIIASTNRETLAGLFSYSSSTIRRKWDDTINKLLFFLVHPELVIPDFKIFPDC